MLQRIQARERLLGHRADLVPLEEPGEKPTSQPGQVRPWGAGRHAGAVGHLQALQLLQGGERPVHVFDGPGDLVLLEVPSDRNREHTVVKIKQPGVSKTSRGFTLRVKRSVLMMFQAAPTSAASFWSLCGAFSVALKMCFMGNMAAEHGLQLGQKYSPPPHTRNISIKVVCTPRSFSF